jgi:hypothetical protein
MPLLDIVFNFNPVLETFPNSTDIENVTREALEQLDETVPSDQRCGCSLRSLVRIGKPYQQIIQLAVVSPCSNIATRVERFCGLTALSGDSEPSHCGRGWFGIEEK